MRRVLLKVRFGRLNPLQVQTQRTRWRPVQAEGQNITRSQDQIAAGEFKSMPHYVLLPADRSNLVTHESPGGAVR
jgi:hypothetical protein